MRAAIRISTCRVAVHGIEAAAGHTMARTTWLLFAASTMCPVTSSTFSRPLYASAYLEACQAPPALPAVLHWLTHSLPLTIARRPTVFTPHPPSPSSPRQVSILEKRLKRHEEAALSKYYDMDRRLRHDFRLSTLLQPQ